MFKIKRIFLRPFIIYISIVEASYVISLRRNYLLWIREGVDIKGNPIQFILSKLWILLLK